MFQSSLSFEEIVRIKLSALGTHRGGCRVDVILDVVWMVVIVDLSDFAEYNSVHKSVFIHSCGGNMIRSILLTIL